MGDVEGEQPHRRLRRDRRVPGLVADQGHLAHHRAGADRGHVVAAGEDARLALEHEEALDADVALVDQDGTRLGIDRLAEGGDPLPARARTSGRTARCDGGRRRSPGSPRSSTACCISPACCAPASQPTRAARQPPSRPRGSSSPAIGPARSTAHGPVRGVDHRRRALAEASRRRRPAPPRRRSAAATAAAVAATGSPCRLALVAASGPTRAATARTRSWSGTRRPIVWRARRGGGRRPPGGGSTSVSGPGHQRAATAATAGSTRGSAQAPGPGRRRAEHRERHVLASVP